MPAAKGKKTPAKKSPAKSGTAKKPVAKSKSPAYSAKKAEEQEKSTRQLWAILLFVAGVFLLCVAFIQGQNVWLFLHETMYGLFGAPAFVLPLILIYIAVMYTLDRSIGSIKHKLWQTGVLVILICGAIQVFAVGSVPEGEFTKQLAGLYQEGIKLHGGGLASALVGWPLMAACGRTGAGIILVLLIFLFIMLLTGGTLIGLFRAVTRPAKKVGENYSRMVEEKKARQEARFDIDVDLGPLPAHPVSSPRFSIDIPLDEEERPGRQEKKAASKPKTEPRKEPAPEQDLYVEPGAAEPSSPVIDDLIQRAVREESPKAPPAVSTPMSEEEKTKLVTDVNNQTRLYADNPAASHYNPPPISLLKMGRTTNKDVSGELKSNADKLVDTLKSFGVQTRIINISRGPTVTRYELQPSAGVKISKITGLADDIALNLAAAGVRIEAPIPGKPAVGIEVPNQATEVVTIREIVESGEFEKSPGKLTVALGRDISGNAKVADLAKMPHILIAGSTGSGKSVCINSFIISLLYKSRPEEVKLLMIDPKVVELGIYNGIPHLLIPVVTDPRKAAGALGWAVTEMLKRYKIFADNGVRDLKGYNQLVQEQEDLEPMPQIVIIIDELADLMMAAPNEVEDAICRLAQMARAAGMHLVIATQRPSVDVITGVIKANIPSRIAFAVSSQVDSRTILDGSGAEKLLGRGDMLFAPVGSPKPTRIQGCFVSDKEVEQVVDFVKNKATVEYDEQILEEIEKQAAKDPKEKDSGGGFDDEDDMMPAAIECVIEAGQASTSFLQRRLKLGYARAARLIDQMEERGVVGPFEGSKPRQVLMTRQQWQEMTLNQDAAAQPEE